MNPLLAFRHFLEHPLMFVPFIQSYTTLMFNCSRLDPQVGKGPITELFLSKYIKEVQYHDDSSLEKLLVRGRIVNKQNGG